MSRAELAEQLENLDEADDNTYSFLFNFLYFDELIFNHRNEEWWIIWDEYEGLVSSTDGAYDTAPQEVTFRDLCSTTSSVCLPYAIVSDNDPPGTVGEGGDNVQFRDCDGLYVQTVYLWECPGGSGGYVPGGGISTGGSSSSGSGGSGTWGSAGAGTLAQVIMQCTAETSPDVVVDNPQYGENLGDCELLLGAIELFGIDAFPASVWIYMFEHRPDLLEVAMTIEPEQQHVYVLYVLNTLSGNTNQSFRAFEENYEQVEALQIQLDFDGATFEWLFNQAISIPARETSMADEIEGFLDTATGSERDWKITLVEILLADVQTGNLTASFVAQVSAFWEAHYTGTNEVGLAFDLGQYYLRSNDGGFGMTFEEFELNYEEWLEDVAVEKEPLTPGDIFAIANPIREQLEMEYMDDPVALGKISSWFICRVMGIGFQEIAIESLGRGNFELIDSSLPGINARPDGYHRNSIQHDFAPITSVGNTHTITEIKGIFSGSPPTLHGKVR